MYLNFSYTFSSRHFHFHFTVFGRFGCDNYRRQGQVRGMFLAALMSKTTSSLISYARLPCSSFSRYMMCALHSRGRIHPILRRTVFDCQPYYINCQKSLSSTCSTDRLMIPAITYSYNRIQVQHW